MSNKTPENPVTPPTPPVSPGEASLGAGADDAPRASQQDASEPPLLEEQIGDATAPPPPRQEAAAKPRRGQPPRKPPVRRRRWLGPLLFLLVLVAGAFFAWQWWQGLHQQQQGWRNAVATLERKQAQLSDELAASQAAATSRFTELENALQTAVATRQAGSDEAPALADHALLEEAITLAVLAQQQLLLTGEVASARRLLSVADEVLAQASDTAFVAVREAIAVDMQRLAAADHLDLTALILRLNGLQAQVPALVVPRHVRVQAGEQQVAPAGEGFWARLWARLPVRVRDHGSAVPLPLDADSQQLLRLSLESALQEARLALLQGRGVVFEAALARADGLLQQWFAQADPAVVAFREALAELRAVPVARAVPEIDQALSLMRQLREAR